LYPKRVLPTSPINIFALFQFQYKNPSVATINTESLKSKNPASPKKIASLPA